MGSENRKKTQSLVVGEKREDEAGALLSAPSRPPKHLTSLSSHLPELLPTLRLWF